MKNQFLMVCMVIALLATTSSSFSATHPAPKAPAFETVIDDYINSFMNSDFKTLNKILSDEALVKIPRAENVIVQYKTDLVAAMKADATKQDCTSEYEIVAKSDAIIIARVDFQYTNFKQQNFLTLEKDENKQWKITQVCRFYKNNDQSTGSSEGTVTIN